MTNKTFFESLKYFTQLKDEENRLIYPMLHKFNANENALEGTKKSIRRTDFYPHKTNKSGDTQRQTWTEDKNNNILEGAM